MSYNQSEELERRMKLNEIEKDLELLKLLHDKKVNLIRVDIADTCLWYNCYFKHVSELQLTEEEFKRIKKWLKGYGI